MSGGFFHDTPSVRFRGKRHFNSTAVIRVTSLLLSTMCRHMVVGCFGRMAAERMVRTAASMFMLFLLSPACVSGLQAWILSVRRQRVLGPAVRCSHSQLVLLSDRERGAGAHHECHLGLPQLHRGCETRHCVPHPRRHGNGFSLAK